MSLLTICQNAADEAGFPRPSTIVGNTDQLARQLLAMAKATLEDLGRKEWPILQREHSFATVAGTDDYTLPTGFKRLIVDTAYVATEYYKMRASMSPSEWQARRNEMASATGRYGLRVYGQPSKIWLTPEPTTVETVLFEYVTLYNALTSGGTAKETFTLDTDTPMLRERIVELGIIWRIRHAKGLDYAENRNEYDEAISIEFAQQLGHGSIPVAVRNPLGDEELTLGYVPEQGYG